MRRFNTEQVVLTASLPGREYPASVPSSPTSIDSQPSVTASSMQAIASKDKDVLMSSILLPNHTTDFTSPLTTLTRRPSVRQIILEASQMSIDHEAASLNIKSGDVPQSPFDAEMMGDWLKNQRLEAQRKNSIVRSAMPSKVEGMKSRDMTVDVSNPPCCGGENINLQCVDRRNAAVHDMFPWRSSIYGEDALEGMDDFRTRARASSEISTKVVDETSAAEGPGKESIERADVNPGRRAQTVSESHTAEDVYIFRVLCNGREGKFLVTEQYMDVMSSASLIDLCIQSTGLKTERSQMAGNFQLYALLSARLSSVFQLEGQASGHNFVPLENWSPSDKVPTLQVLLVKRFFQDVATREGCVRLLCFAKGRSIPAALTATEKFWQLKPPIVSSLNPSSVQQEPGKETKGCEVRKTRACKAAEATVETALADQPGPPVPPKSISSSDSFLRSTKDLVRARTTFSSLEQALDRISEIGSDADQPSFAKLRRSCSDEGIEPRKEAPKSAADARPADADLLSHFSEESARESLEEQSKVGSLCIKRTHSWQNQYSPSALPSSCASVDEFWSEDSRSTTSTASIFFSLRAGCHAKASQMRSKRRFPKKAAPVDLCASDVESTDAAKEIFKPKRVGAEDRVRHVAGEEVTNVREKILLLRSKAATFRVANNASFRLRGRRAGNTQKTPEERGSMMGSTKSTREGCIAILEPRMPVTSSNKDEIMKDAFIVQSATTGSDAKAAIQNRSHRPNMRLSTAQSLPEHVSTALVADPISAPVSAPTCYSETSESSSWQKGRTDACPSAPATVVSLPEHRHRDSLILTAPVRHSMRASIDEGSAHSGSARPSSAHTSFVRSPLSPLIAGSDSQAGRELISAQAPFPLRKNKSPQPLMADQAALRKCASLTTSSWINVAGPTTISGGGWFRCADTVDSGARDCFISIANSAEGNADSMGMRSTLPMKGEGLTWSSQQTIERLASNSDQLPLQASQKIGEERRGGSSTNLARTKSNVLLNRVKALSRTRSTSVSTSESPLSLVDGAAATTHDGTIKVGTWTLVGTVDECTQRHALTDVATPPLSAPRRPSISTFHRTNV